MKESMKLRVTIASHKCQGRKETAEVMEISTTATTKY
jgi:hypothetical protein